MFAGMVDSMFTSAFAELVAAVVDMRKKAGLTQRELARRMAREQNFVARVETGQRRLDLIELIQICQACGVSPEQEMQRLTRRIVKLVSKAPGR